MLLFGPELRTATAVAWASGIVGTLLIWLAARTLGLARGPAFIAAALATGIPYSAWLGVASVPELLTTGLVVFGASTLATSHRNPAQPATRARNWGALALACATLSRYETWPVAAAFTVFCLWDAFRYRKLEPTRMWAFGTASLLASAGMLLWMSHGWASHGDATFFIERVAHYQKALGGHDFHGWAAFSRHPLLVVTHAPALMAAATLGVALVLLLRIEVEGRLARLTRPLVTCAGLVVFLMIGDLRGAGATHHPARTLLPVWSFACIVIAATWPGLILRAWEFITIRSTKWGSMRPRLRSIALTLALITTLGAVLIVDGAQNQVLDGPQRFVDRSHELRLGERARRVVTTGRLLIAPEDYGYFAMIAAFAAPRRADTVDDRDPRHARLASLFDSPQALQRRLEHDRVQGLIVSQAHARQAQHFGTTVAMTPRYLLLAVGPQH
jgi:hypothetical protein